MAIWRKHAGRAMPANKRSPLCGALLLAGLAAGCVPSADLMTDAAEDAQRNAEIAQAAADVQAANVVPIRTGEGTATISGSAAIDRAIERHAREAGVPPALAYAVVRVESRYNPSAKGAGVYGLSQIMPATARSLGFSGSVSDLYDPDTNLTYGMKYLAGAWEKSGRDICGTAVKYKGGHRATRMTASAQRYCSQMKEHMAELAQKRGLAGAAVPKTTAEAETRSAEKAQPARTLVAALSGQQPSAPGRGAPGQAVPAQSRAAVAVPAAAQAAVTGQASPEPRAAAPVAPAATVADAATPAVVPMPTSRPDSD